LSKKVEKGFETPLFLLCGLKHKPSLPKTHFLEQRPAFEFHLPLESLSIVFTR